ncbi:MBL fold metallo-hydrolase [Candidatus Microgenomates bacterium]|nr:MBL fold metallo-hydrolase [Candidatus Microgenomates bacterium]
MVGKTEKEMKVITHRVGELQANCYFLIQDKDCVVIDPGDSADFLLEEVSRNNYSVKGIIATHGHFDHVMGAGEMQLALGVPFYLNLKDQFLMDRLESTAKHFLGYEPQIIRPHETTDIFFVPAIPMLKGVRLMESPGHTPGSICLYCEEEQIVFTGDTLFKDGIGRYDFSYSDKKELFRSLYELFELPEETLVYSGHGDPTTIGEEKSRY